MTVNVYLMFCFVEKADKGKCPFMANEVNATKTVEEPVQGETVPARNEQGGMAKNCSKQEDCITQHVHA